MLRVGCVCVSVSILFDVDCVACCVVCAASIVVWCELSVSHFFIVHTQCVVLWCDVLSRTHRRNAVVNVSNVVGFFRRSLAMSVWNLLFCFFIIFRMSTFNVMYVCRSLACVSERRLLYEVITTRWQMKCLCVCVCVYLRDIICRWLFVFIHIFVVAFFVFPFGKKTSN